MAKVAVIGYGSQGHAHALNLKESGADVIVGSPGSSSWERQSRPAEGDGTAEAAEAADLIMMLVPDEKQAKLYRESIEPSKPGNALMFAGFNIHFGQIVPPDEVDVIMVAPRPRAYGQKPVPGGQRGTLSDCSSSGCHRKGP